MKGFAVFLAAIAVGAVVGVIADSPALGGIAFVLVFFAISAALSGPNPAPPVWACERDGRPPCPEAPCFPTCIPKDLHDGR